MIARTRLRRALAGALILTLTGPARADEDGPAIEAEARRLLDEVAAAYRALPAYADQGRFTQSRTVNGQPRGETTPVPLRFARPDRIDLEAGPVRFVSDGTTMTTLVAPLRAYAAAPAPQAITPETFANLSPGAFLFGSPSGPPLGILLELLAGADPAKALLERAEALRVEPEREVEGRPLRPLLLRRDDGLDVRLLVDPESRLVRRIEMSFADLAGKLPPGASLGDVALTWDSGPISTEPPGAGAFDVPPPPEFRKITALADRAAKEAPEAGQPGTPAPDFTLTLLDPDGGTRKVSKADLAGKVVVLDFWATWCGPCLRELPDVQAMIDAYTEARKADDLLIVALSEDDEPADPVAIRKKVEATLAKLEVDPAGSPVAAVGLDPTHAVAKAFGVRGYPTIVLLDADGVVQAVHLGVTDRQTLTTEIDALLRGEPLVKPRAGAAEVIR